MSSKKGTTAANKAAAPANKTNSYDHLIKLLLIGDSGNYESILICRRWKELPVAALLRQLLYAVVHNDDRH